MPYYIVDGKDPIGEYERKKHVLRPYRDLKSIRASIRYLNAHCRYMKVPPIDDVILHVKRDGTVEVVE
jgi:hypothetical protein